MTKNFPTSASIAMLYVTEPPWLWERAKDWLTKDEYEALKNTIWYDPEIRSADRQWQSWRGNRFTAYRWIGRNGQRAVALLSAPASSNDIQRALNVRNLNHKTALTKRAGRVSSIIGGSYEPAAAARHGCAG